MTDIYKDRRELLPVIGLGVPEAAQCIGISERTLRALTARGEVPHVRIGSRIIYPVKPLTDWLNGKAVFGDESLPAPVQADVQLARETEASAAGAWPMTRITAVTPN